MKTKCFILILLSCLFFSLYSCGKSGNISSDSNESNSNEPLTYELGEYDIQNKTEVKNKKNYYTLNVNIPITNTSSSSAIIPTFIIEYTIQEDTFTKEATVFPFILAPNETGTISLETSSDRDEISFKTINEKKIKSGTKIFLDIISQEVITEHHTGQNQSDCYDYQVTYTKLSLEKLKKYANEISILQMLVQNQTQIIRTNIYITNGKYNFYEEHSEYSINEEIIICKLNTQKISNPYLLFVAF